MSAHTTACALMDLSAEANVIETALANASLAFSAASQCITPGGRRGARNVALGHLHAARVARVALEALIAEAQGQAP